MATSVRLTREIEERLNFLSSMTGRTKAYYLRQIIEKGLNDMEDYYIASEVLERIRKGEEKIFSADETEKYLDMAD
ncbi:MAG: type II toxin-antitoxin system RelB family antitoxin [bacterium]